MIQFPCERSSDCRLCPTMLEFFEINFCLSLVDSPLMEKALTWSNGHMSSRLDRFLVSSKTESNYPDVFQK